MKGKPVKLGICLYVVAEWKTAYLFSLSENTWGNQSSIPAAMTYSSWFWDVRTILEQQMSKNDVKNCSASALWLLLRVHQNVRFGSPSGGYLAVTDNFYTWHSIGRALVKLTDGEMKLLGTFRVSKLSGTECLVVRSGINEMKTRKRGAWLFARRWILLRVV